MDHEFFFFLLNGIFHYLKRVNTPQQNEVAKRKNFHLLKVAKALLFQIFVPKTYWGGVVLSATYLINRLPTHVLNAISPSEPLLCLFHSSSVTLPCRIFGYVTFVHSHNPNHNKLDHRALKCVFIDYPSNKKGCKCYPQSRCVLTTMHCTFRETIIFCQSFTLPMLSPSMKL